MFKLNKFVSINTPKEILSLNQFIEFISNCEESLKNLNCEDNYNQYTPSRLFYRGEARDYGDTSNIAGIYRGYNQGSALYHEYIRRFRKIFKNMDNFSKLTYMQHYGLPTCLIDITSNALVALYFACKRIYHCPKYKSYNSKYKTLREECKHNEDCNDKYELTSPKYSGIVYLITPKNQDVSNFIRTPYKIYNNNCDSIELLATLSLLKEETQHKLINDFNDFNKIINNNTVDAYDVFYILYVNNRITKKIYSRLSFSKLYKYFKKDVQLIIKGELITNYNINDLSEYLNDHKLLFKLYVYFRSIANKYFDLIGSYEFKNFIHKIRQNIGDFSSSINLKNILKPMIVQPALNNRRVKAQQGYFIFESQLNNNYDAKSMSKNLGRYFTMSKIIIPNYIKSSILMQLDKNFNINDATLFPDPENVAGYVRKTFKIQAKFKRNENDNRLSKVLGRKHRNHIPHK